MIIYENADRKKIAAIKARYTNTSKRYMEYSEHLRVLEQSYDIPERWTRDSQKYKEGLVFLRERKYKLAVDKLEALLVQRLFELTKLGLSGTGKSTL